MNALSRPRTTRALAAAAGIAVLSTLATLGGGCVGYTAAPLTKDQSVFSDPNAPTTRDVSTVALKWVIHRYPPEGGDGRLVSADESMSAPPTASSDDAPARPRLAINLPAGTRAELYQRVCKDIGMGAAPMSPETADLPTYSVGRVWVMGDEATVDVFRPIPEMGKGPDGKPVYQAITVRMRGGLKPWAYTRHQSWTAGALPVPEANFITDAPKYTPMPGATTRPGD